MMKNTEGGRLDVGQLIDIVGVGGPRDRHPLSWNKPNHGRMVTSPFFHNR